MKKHVLIIGDELASCRQLKYSLENETTAVYYTLTVYEGLKRFMEHRYCLVILDIHLKAWNGYALIEQIRRIRPIPMLVISAGMERTERLSVFEAGADHRLLVLHFRISNKWRTSQMAEERIYTIIVNKKRIEVSQEVYKAYHKHREAERYRRGLISQIEMSLDRFLEDGVSVEYEIARTNPSIEDELIKKEDYDRLRQALISLKAEEQLLIDELFFRETLSLYWRSVWELPSRLSAVGERLYCGS